MAAGECVGMPTSERLACQRNIAFRDFATDVGIGAVAGAAVGAGIGGAMGGAGGAVKGGLAGAGAGALGGAAYGYSNMVADFQDDIRHLSDLVTTYEQLNAEGQRRAVLLESDLAAARAESSDRRQIIIKLQAEFSRAQGERADIERDLSLSHELANKQQQSGASQIAQLNQKINELNTIKYQMGNRINDLNRQIDLYSNKSAPTG